MDDPTIDAMARRLDRLDRENRRLKWAGGLAAAGVAVALAFPGAWRPRPAAAGQVERPAAVGQVERPEPADRPAAELVQERLEVAQKAIGIIMRSWARGAPDTNSAGEIYYWSTVVLGSHLFLSMAEGEPRVENANAYLALKAVKPNPARIVAFEQHLARMRTWEDRLRPLAQKGVLSTLGFLSIESRRLEAEIWLARERENVRLAREPR